MTICGLENALVQKKESESPTIFKSTSELGMSELMALTIYFEVLMRIENRVFQLWI
jgi:hypothetical protein